jgi:predicted MFS family arabinose efflux permease
MPAAAPPVHDPAPTPGRILAVVAVLALGPAIGLGFGRFAYALVLPDMRADLAWSYAQAGWMNSLNAAGYLLGALLAAPASRIAGAFRTLATGVVLAVAALALPALFRDFAVLGAARFLAGLGGGLAFVAGGVLAAAVVRHDPRRAAMLLGLYYAGPGLGILMSGLTVPAVLAVGGPGTWPWAWGALALMAVPLAIAVLVMRDGAAAGTAAGKLPRFAAMGWILAGYFCFGAGYIAYMTYMIAWVRESGGGAGFQAVFWIVLGLSAITSPWVGAWVMRRSTRARAFATMNALTALGAALPLVAVAAPAVTVPVALLSAAFFGVSFMSVVATTTDFVRRNLPEPTWAAAIAALTVDFGLGQIVGPVAIGALSDLAGLAGGLGLSVVFLLLGSALGLVQRDAPKPAG